MRLGVFDNEEAPGRCDQPSQDHRKRVRNAKAHVRCTGRLHPNKEENAPALLKYEVEHWLGEIARPVEINAERYPGSSVTTLRFRSPGGTEVRGKDYGKDFQLGF